MRRMRMVTMMQRASQTSACSLARKPLTGQTPGLGIKSSSHPRAGSKSALLSSSRSTGRCRSLILAQLTCQQSGDRHGSDAPRLCQRCSSSASEEVSDGRLGMPKRRARGGMLGREDGRGRKGMGGTGMMLMR